MTIQHWKLSLNKNGQRITLYVSTSDQMIEQDLAKDLKDSLIHTARQYHRRGQTPFQDHCDLAVGALMAYAGQPPYDLAFEQIESISSVPECEPTFFVTGDRDGPHVPIWEEAEEDPEAAEK
jgi:hypothetical protein